MSRLDKFVSVLLVLIVFAIPIEHKYDKPLRHYSIALIPDGLVLEHFDKKIYFYATDVAIIALFLLALFALRIPLRRLLFEKGTLLLWVVFACALASICASPLYNYPVVYTRLLGILTAILLFSFLANLEHSTKRTNLIFSVFFAASLLQSAIAIAQYFLQHQLGLTLLSEPKIATGSFPMPNGSRWVFDSLFGIVKTSSHVVRSCGTMHHCNLLGSFLAISLLASYSLIVSAARRWIRLLFALFLPVQFFALCTAYSRSAIFGWALGTLTWFGYAAFQRTIRSVASDRSFRFLAAMIAISASISAALLFDQFANRGGIVNYNSLAEGSDSIRMKAQNAAFRMIKEHPLLGAGYQQYAPSARTFLPAGQAPDTPHNIYLLIASETGLVSLAAFLCFLALLWIRAVRSPFTPQTASLLAIFAAFLFIGCCDFTSLLLQPTRLLFFCTAGLLAAESQAVRDSFAAKSLCS